jgi:hypothetical protein
VLAAGGFGAAGPLASAELYNPVTTSWTTTGPLTEARERHTATLLPNGQVLVAGGVGTATTLSSAEIYTPAGTWIAAGALNTARWHHTATLLPNGQVLAVGGFDAVFRVLASAELYRHPGGDPFLLLLLGE